MSRKPRIDWEDSVPEHTWQSIVDPSANSYLFHTPLWTKILAETYPMRPAARLYRVDGMEVLVPMIEERHHLYSSYNAVPLGYGGIFSPHPLTEEQIDALLRTIVGGMHPIFKFTLPPFWNIAVPEDTGFVEQKNDHAHVISLDAEFESLSQTRFRRLTRRCIRAARTQGVETHPAAGAQAFQAFYPLYAERAREWGYRTPPLPERLFHALAGHAGHQIRLHLAEVDGELAAGLVSLWHGEGIHFLIDATPSRFRRTFANYMLFWDVIEEACREGYRWINLASSLNNEGLRRFKEGFGAVEVDVKGYIACSRLGKCLTALSRRRPARPPGADVQGDTIV